MLKHVVYYSVTRVVCELRSPVRLKTSLTICELLCLSNWQIICLVLASRLVLLGEAELSI
jgi:hypothetical protein